MKEKCDIFFLRFPLKSNKFDQGPEAVLPSEDKLVVFKKKRSRECSSVKTLSYFFAPFSSLSFNRLQRLPKGLLDNASKLETLKLDHNPLVCDCKIRWLSEWMLDQVLSLTQLLSLDYLDEQLLEAI